jgi:hypothetical protein
MGFIARQAIEQGLGQIKNLSFVFAQNLRQLMTLNKHSGPRNVTFVRTYIRIFKYKPPQEEIKTIVYKLCDNSPTDGKNQCLEALKGI